MRSAGDSRAGEAEAVAAGGAAGAPDEPERGARFYSFGEYEKLLAQIAASPVRDRIVWAGLQQDPLPWYQAMDLLVIASESEGMPNAALESMACGVPVLANEVCGVREVAGDGSHSWIEDLGSADLIASSLARISALPAPVLAATGAAARLHAETELSLEAMMERYRRLYSGEFF